MTNDKQRERLVELFENLEDPSSTCPRFGTNKVCEGCKYLKGDDCDLTGRFVDYLLANGVIAPPCKVGDIFYGVNETEYDDYEVLGFKWGKRRGDDEYVLIVLTVYDMEFEWGEEAFLTKEEAEKALGGVQG